MELVVVVVVLLVRFNEETAGFKLIRETALRNGAGGLCLCEGFLRSTTLLLRRRSAFLGSVRPPVQSREGEAALFNRFLGSAFTVDLPAFASKTAVFTVAGTLGMTGRGASNRDGFGIPLISRDIR